MTTSTAVIEGAIARGDGALLAYVPLGYPTVAKSVEAAQLMIENGVDVIELGFPYTDPGMDGPVIQTATVAAIETGTQLEDLFSSIRLLADKGATIVVMTYWNPVHWYGPEKFAASVAEAGGAGIIVPDLPPEEATEWIATTDQLGLETIFLVAPSSTEKRLKLISDTSDGWVYAASTAGPGDDRADIEQEARQLVQRTRAAGARLVCAGLGVSDGQQARDVAQFADGVVVGSAFVRVMSNPDWDEAKTDVVRLTKVLKEGVTGVRRPVEDERK